MLLVLQLITPLNKPMMQSAKVLPKKYKNLKKEVEHFIAHNKDLLLFKKKTNKRKLIQSN